MSDYSHSSSPSNSQSPRSPRYSPRSPNYSDHSMEEAWSPRPFRSPNYPSSPDVHHSSSSNHSQSPRSSSNIEQDEFSRLSPEEDPGPGSVQVQVSDSSTIHFMDKRSLALKSEYFRSYLVRFHTSNMDMHMMNEKTVELNSEFVSSEAWAVLKMYVEFGKLQLHDEVSRKCVLCVLILIVSFRWLLRFCKPLTISRWTLYRLTRWSISRSWCLKLTS